MPDNRMHYSHQRFTLAAYPIPITSISDPGLECVVDECGAKQVFCLKLITLSTTHTNLVPVQPLPTAIPFNGRSPETAKAHRG
eukprot:TRINITY_DN7034_c0_g1_i1.p2 TRINITY_DN7034_c0_g1~~TRINITY_DN7034_c0_g1_i1.p2  ORF type:complete len:83 (-),score=16.07 TRINITY_DN7034_c0_g1_i1:3-251(-)